MARSKENDDPFAAFWPWPGNGFVVATGVWLAYMGWATTRPDLSAAFSGGAIVLAIVLLFGLRARFAARSEVVAAAAGGRPDAHDEALPADARAPMVAVPARMVGPRKGPASRRAAGLPETEIVPLGGKLKPEATTAVLRRMERALRGEASEWRGALADLEARHEARIEALADQVHPHVSGEGGDGQRFLRVAAFNNAVHNNLLPRMEQIVDNRLGKLGDGGADGLKREFGALAETVATVRAELESADDAARQERTILRADAKSARDLAEKAMRLAAAGGTAGPPNLAKAVAALQAAQQDDRKELAALRAALRGDAPTESMEGDDGGAAHGGAAQGARLDAIQRRVAAVETRMNERFEVLDRTEAQVRGNQETLLNHLRSMGEHYHQLIARLDSVRDLLTPAPGETAARERSADVAAQVTELRDALQTLIADNQKIREQQEILSARFEPPTRVDLNPKPGGTAENG